MRAWTGLPLGRPPTSPWPGCFLPTEMSTAFTINKKMKQDAVFHYSDVCISSGAAF